VTLAGFHFSPPYFPNRSLPFGQQEDWSRSTLFPLFPPTSSRPRFSEKVTIRSAMASPDPPSLFIKFPPLAGLKHLASDALSSYLREKVPVTPHYKFFLFPLRQRPILSPPQSRPFNGEVSESKAPFVPLLPGKDASLSPTPRQRTTQDSLLFPPPPVHGGLPFAKNYLFLSQFFFLCFCFPLTMPP